MSLMLCMVHWKSINQNKNHALKKEKKLINAKNFYEGRQIIINAFKNEIFLMTPTGFENDVDQDELLKKR